MNTSEPLGMSAEHSSTRRGNKTPSSPLRKTETRIFLGSLKKGVRYPHMGVQSQAAHAVWSFTEVSTPAVSQSGWDMKGQAARSVLDPYSNTAPFSQCSGWDYPQSPETVFLIQRQSPFSELALLTPLCYPAHRARAAAQRDGN